MNADLNKFNKKTEKNKNFQGFAKKLEENGLGIIDAERDGVVRVGKYTVVAFQLFLEDASDIEIKVDNKGKIRGIIYNDIVIHDVDEDIANLPKKAVEIIKLSTKYRLQKARQKDMKSLGRIEDVMEDAKEAEIAELTKEIALIKKKIVKIKAGV